MIAGMFIAAKSWAKWTGVRGVLSPATGGRHDVEPWYSRPGHTFFISIPDLYSRTRWRGVWGPPPGAYRLSYTAVAIRTAFYTLQYRARAGSRTVLIVSYANTNYNYTISAVSKGGNQKNEKGHSCKQ